MQMRRVSRLCTVSGGTATQIQTSVWIPTHTGYSGRWEEEREEGRQAGRQGERIEKDWAVKQLRKPVFLSPSVSLTEQRAINTWIPLFLPLYFPSGYLFWKAAMHNKGSVLCLLVGWGANTPQLIMCLSVAVWAAAKGIRSSICKCCSLHSGMPRHASQISSVSKRRCGKKKNTNPTF